MPISATSTAKDYILQAYRLCGQIRAGYQVSPEMLDDGLSQWFLMFDAYNTQRTMNYTQPDYVFPILGPGHGVTGNNQSFGGTGYQIGPTALDFSVPNRPVDIIRMNLYMTSASPAQPTRIPLTKISMEEWMNLPVIEIQPAVNVNTTFAYDPQFPNGVIWVWPPLNGNGLEIFTWGALTPPATLSTPYSAPPGYGDLVVKMLAVRLWGLCTKDLFPNRQSWTWITGQAELARQNVANANAVTPRIRCDFGGSMSSRSTGVADWDLLLAGVPY